MSYNRSDHRGVCPKCNHYHHQLRQKFKDKNSESIDSDKSDIFSDCNKVFDSHSENISLCKSSHRKSPHRKLPHCKSSHRKSPHRKLPHRKSHCKSSHRKSPHRKSHCKSSHRKSPHRKSHCKSYEFKLKEKAVENLVANSWEARTSDGKGNNIAHPEWGAAEIQLLRLTDADYKDGISEMVTDRPNPRTISNIVVAQNKPTINSKKASAMFWLFGQFLDHDLDLTDPDPNEPAPIPVPPGDPVFTQPVIPFDRSLYDKKVNPTQPRQQTTSVTAYLDGSNIYGSDEHRLEFIRLHHKGKMLLTGDGLPPVNNGKYANAGPIGQNIFVCGDIRANEHIGLLTMHTLFIREHNYWAKCIRRANRKFNDEEIFQRARVMVEAELQSITYDEFLSLLLGENALVKYAGYKSDVNASIANEFSTAAYRLGHSLVSSSIKRLKENGCPISWGNMKLLNTFFSPSLLCNQGGIDPVLRGFAATFSEELDHQIINDLRNFLFGPGSGIDLAALNIQRGRDHGLPPLNRVRSALNLPVHNNFISLTQDPDLALKLASVYDSVDKVDLWVGGLCEAKYKEALVGETFFAILVNQFTRLRDGDRFWYENRLTPDMIKLVKETRLSDIIKRNTNIKTIQKFAFIQEERKCNK